MRTIRVLLLSTDLERGGLPLRLVQFARRAREIDVTPIVGCLAPRGPLNDVLESAGIETFACDARSRFDVSCISRLAGHIRRINPDLIHSSLFHANIAARIAGRADRSRPIITSTVTIELERRWHRVFESLTVGASDLHIANSRAVRDHLCDELAFPADRVIVIPNAIDFVALDAMAPAARSDLGFTRDRPLVVWAGRMDPVKNLPAFIEVISILNARSPVQALIIGDGPERSRIESLARARRIDHVVRFAGWRGDVVSWMKSADLLLFPSRTEGSPNVVLEALAVGCPVVASTAPACVELIHEAGCGETCQYDDIDGFVSAAGRALSDRSVIAQCAKNAVGRIRAIHDAAQIMPLWRAAYERVLGSQL